MSSTPATLIGVPLDLGAKNLGVDIGPDAFRYQGLIAKLRGAGLDITDTGNIAVTEREKLQPGNDRLRYLEEIVRVNEALAAQVDQTITAGKKAVIVGGDHSLNLGAVAGASKAVAGDIGMIYFDAHGDMNTDKTTLSGNIHGMHVASLMGFGASELVNVYGPGTKLDKANLLHIGGSDFDQAELDLVKNEGLTAYMLKDVLKYNLAPLFDKIDALSKKVANIWVSLDLDCIDKIYAPGAGMPNAKGLTYREMAVIGQHIGETCNVIGVDIVEYNPLLDENRKTAELGIEMIATFFGKDYSWYTQYMADNSL